MFPSSTAKGQEGPRNTPSRSLSNKCKSSSHLDKLWSQFNLEFAHFPNCFMSHSEVAHLFIWFLIIAGKSLLDAQTLELRFMFYWEVSLYTITNAHILCRNSGVGYNLKSTPNGHLNTWEETSAGKRHSPKTNTTQSLDGKENNQEWGLLKTW